MLCFVDAMLLNINVILTRSYTWSYAMNCIYNDLWPQLLIQSIALFPFYLRNKKKMRVRVYCTSFTNEYRLYN